jgi:hypothetical protein
MIGYLDSVIVICLVEVICRRRTVGCEQMIVAAMIMMIRMMIIITNKTFALV